MSLVFLAKTSVNNSTKMKKQDEDESDEDEEDDEIELPDDSKLNKGCFNYSKFLVLYFVNDISLNSGGQTSSSAGLSASKHNKNYYKTEQQLFLLLSITRE